MDWSNGHNSKQSLVFKTSDWTLQNTINVGKGLSEVTFSNDGTLAFACINGWHRYPDGCKLKNGSLTLTVGTDPVGAWSASNGKMCGQ